MWGKGSDTVAVDCHMHMVLDGRDWRSAIADTQVAWISLGCIAF